MAKDPAVLFYTSDFLSGTFTMTDEQVGKYMRLLCIQHQKGMLTEQDMLSICKAYDEQVYSKFVREGGYFYNIRMKTEADRRKKFSESRKKNAESVKNQQDKPKSTSKAYAKHMETETINENETINTTEFVNPFGENFSAWSGWLDYKREEHREKYRSPKTEQAAADKLYKLSGGNQETAKLIIQQSIENRWKGLFELKNTSNGTKKTGHPTFDDVQAAFNRSVNQRQQAGD